MDNKKTRVRRKIVYYSQIMCIFAAAAAALAAGSAVVSVNCHNAMYSDKMVLFDAYRSEDGIVITFMDKEYKF